MQLWDDAVALHEAGMYEQAEPKYDELLTQNHDNAGLLATMGTLQLHLKKVGLAMTLLHAAVDQLERKRKPVPGDILANLGMCYKYSGQRDKAIEILRRSCKASATAENLTVLGSMFVEAGQPSEAIEINRKAIKANAEYALAHWNLSLALLETGQWQEAWDHYDYGFSTHDESRGIRRDRKLGGKPMWDGTHGQTVVVYGEQGIGDEIMFASMLPDLMKTNTVIFECHTRLVTLFEKAFPGLKCYGTRESDSAPWHDTEQYDAYISIGSLGKFYRRSREAFPGTPYLKADPAPRSDKFRVGISWTGGQKAGRVLRRSVPLHWWKSILDVKNVEFVSLQYTECAEEIAEVNALGYDIKQFDEVKAHDYYETAKLVQSCDLVITCCTSVVHLAGALGVPCWVMTPKHPAWRYQNEGGMPFYKSVRLYRQSKVEGAKELDLAAWMPVVNRIGLDLETLVRQQRKEAA